MEQLTAEDYMRWLMETLVTAERSEYERLHEAIIGLHETLQFLELCYSLDSHESD